MAQQCGLVSDRAEAGFKALERRLIAEEALAGERLLQARVAGGIAFALEYQNRGLGGARLWCRTEGLEASRRFESVPLE